MNTQTENTNKKIGLYFGSFNPVHLGHVNIAQYLIDNQYVDEVWFVVSPHNPLKEDTELVDENIRLKMVELAIQNHPQLKVSDLEFSLPKPSYTINSLHAFSEKYPENKFYLLIGSDNVLIFDQWKDYQKILEEYPVLVYPRKNFDVSHLLSKYPQMKFLSTPYYDISSSAIRQALKEQKDVGKWLHPAVYQFIIENKLYQQ